MSLVAVLLVATSVAWAEKQPAPKKILILNSFNSSVVWETMIGRTFRAAMAASRIGPLEIREENLDLSSGTFEGHRAILLKLLRIKYSHRALDLVVAVSDPASDFLFEYGQKVFPGIPQVVSGSSRDALTHPPRNRRMTSVYFEMDMLGSVKFALKLLPATRKVVVVSGSDPFSSGYLQKIARSQLAGLGAHPQVTYTSKMTMEEMLRLVAQLSPDHLIYYLGFPKDSEGKLFPNNEACQVISQAANAPVIGIVDTMLGNGVLGGRLASAEVYGRTLAKVALRILAGENPDDIPPVKTVDLVAFDWRQLKRWGLLDHPLLAGAEIRYRQYSFLDLYWHWVLVGAGLLLLQALVILLLLVQRRLKREKELERQRSERALRENEELFRQMFYSDRVMQLVVDPDNGAIIDANQAACKFYGYSHAEMTAKKIFDINAADSGKVTDLLTRVENRNTLSFQTTHRLASNEVRDVEVYSSPLTQRGRTFLHSSIIDITARKQAEDALLRSEAQFRALVENAPVAVVIQTGGYTAYVNNKAIEAFGAQRKEDLLGQSMLDQVDPSLHDLIKERMRLVNQERLNPPPMEYRFVRLDGSRFDVEVMAVPINYQGEDGALVFFQDISQKKKQQADREKLEAQLRQAQKMEAIGTLAGGIAHDFNNILAVVIGFTEMAIAKAQGRRDDAKELQQILKAGERARELVRQILTFSRKVEVDLIPLDLNKELKFTADLLRRTLPKMISVETNLAPDLMPILADANQLEQIMLNLAANAQHAMPEGGRLIIDTQNISLSDEYCARHLEMKPGRYVLLQISDTGQGMDERTREHIFDPFYTTKDVGEGTGLGLSTVFGIVKAFQGHISCYSEPGLGTAFKIYLPAFEDETNWKNTSPSKELELQVGSETILLVDDEGPLRDLGTQILSLAGYTMLTAKSGEEALEIYVEKEESLDLVILDLGMPGIGGYKALEGILEINPQAKVIIASGYAANGAVKKVLHSGAAGFLAKPFNTVKLLATVRQVLDEV